jgi:hypothetical protein
MSYIPQTTVLDQRIVCGMHCTWWDGIEMARPIPGQVGSRGHPLRGCPYCHSTLLQLKDPADWWDCQKKYEMKGHDGYVEFISWLKGKCFPDMETAQIAYQASGRRKVVL